MIEPFVFVGAQYGIRGDKGTRQIDLAAQFWVPPTVGYADMALLHRVVHGDLREHRALGVESFAQSPSTKPSFCASAGCKNNWAQAYDDAGIQYFADPSENGSSRTPVNTK